MFRGVGRTALSVLLAAIIAVAAGGAAVALWARDSILDERGFVAATAPVVARDDVRDAIATITADAVAEAAGPLSAPAREELRSGARDLAGSEEFAGLWKQANAAAHQAARGAFTEAQRPEPVVLDLGALADLVVARLQQRGVDVQQGDVDRSRTRVVVLRPADAGAARDVTRWTQRLSVVLPAIAGGLLVALLLLARRRGLALLALGAATACVGLAAGQATSSARDEAVARSGDGPDGVIERAYAGALTEPLDGRLDLVVVLSSVLAAGGGIAAVVRRATAEQR